MATDGESADEPDASADSGEGSSEDAGADAAAVGEADAGADAGAVGEADAGADAGAVGEPDAGADAGAVGEPDAGADAGAVGEPDAGADAGAGGQDAGPDGGEASEDAGAVGADAGADAQQDAGADAGFTADDGGPSTQADAGSDADTSECADGDLDTQVCGLNGRGNEARMCQSGHWSAFGPCLDPDECKDATEQTGSCGLNARGTETRSCVSGAWSTWVCSDPDECQDGATGSSATDCGPGSTGPAQRQCVDGAWGEESCECQPGYRMNCQAACVPASDVVYIKPTNASCQDGLSWATAYTTLTEAIGAAAEGGEVHFAGGFYSVLDDAVEVTRAVSLLGGFAGSDANPNLRDPVAYPSVLERGGDMGRGFLIMKAPSGESLVEDLTFRLAYFAIHAESTTLTVRRSTFYYNSGPNGSAIDAWQSEVNVYDSLFQHNLALNGGALRNVNIVDGCRFIDNGVTEVGGAIYSAALVRNSTFEGNFAEYGGAVAYVRRIEDSTFEGNGGTVGGAVYLTELEDHVILRSTFRENRAQNGGAIVMDGSLYDTAPPGSLTIVNSQFLKNIAITVSGGAISMTDRVALTLTNDLFVENRALDSISGQGGALHYWSDLPLRIAHCTFAKNEAASRGGALALGTNTFNLVDAEIVNSVFTGNLAPQDTGHIYDLFTASSISGSCLAGQVWTGDGDDNSSGVPTFQANSYRPAANSVIVNAGLANLLPVDTLDLDDDGSAVEPLSLDLDELPRQVGAPDMGCYERQP